SPNETAASMHDPQTEIRNAFRSLRRASAATALSLAQSCSCRPPTAQEARRAQADRCAELDRPQFAISRAPNVDAGENGVDANLRCSCLMLTSVAVICATRFT